MGFTNLYSWFIQFFSYLDAPLQALTVDGVDMVAGLDSLACYPSFQSHLEAFSTTPFLLLVSLTRKFFR